MISHWLITPSHPGGLSYLEWALAVVLLLTDFGEYINFFFFLNFSTVMTYPHISVRPFRIFTGLR